MELIVIRHGQSYVNLGNWDTLDTMDTALTDLGHQQAGALRDWLKNRNATAVALYTSTMKRCVETADYVSDALGLPPRLDDRIREIGNVYLDAKPINESDLPRAFVTGEKPSQFFPVATDVENVESWMHFRIRLGQFIDEMLEKHLDETVYVVAHGGVMAAMVDNLFNVGIHRTCDIHSDNTAWMRVKYQSSPFADWTLTECNRVDHLIKADLL